MVVASDATHLYANMLEGRPFPIVYDMGRVFEAYARLHSLADSTDHIVPGHDPLVMAHYPAPAPELEGIVARLDVAPRRLG